MYCFACFSTCYLNQNLKGKIMTSLNLSSDGEWISFLEKKKNSNMKKSKMQDISILASDKYYLSTDLYCSDAFGNEIFVIGTCLYKEQLGLSALRNILFDFDEKNIISLKKELLGVYIICIVKNGYTFVFNDYYGVFDIFYYEGSGKLYISSNLSDFSYLPIELKLDKYQIMSKLILSNTFSNSSIFESVRRLKGREYIRISDKALNVVTISNNSYSHRYAYKNEKDALLDLVDMQKQNSRVLSRNFKNMALHLTGGLDSRCAYSVLSSELMGEKNRINFFYGHGGITMPSDLGDFRIVKKMSEIFNERLIEFDWSDNPKDFSFDFESNKRYWNDYGDAFDFYIGNKNFFDTYSSICDQKAKPDFMEYGYFLEAMRLREWAEEKNTKFIDIDDYIDNYLLGRETFFNQRNLDEFRELLKIEVLRDVDNSEIDLVKNRISINDFERLRWNISRSCDSRSAVFANNFSYSFPLFGVPCVHELILSLPAKAINKGRFQISFIEKMDRRLALDVSVFSHRRSFYVKNNRKIKKIDFKNTADFVFKYLPILKSSMITLYRNKNYGNFKNLNESIANEILKLDCEAKSVLDPKRIRYSDLPNELMRLRQLLKIQDF